MDNIIILDDKNLKYDKKNIDQIINSLGFKIIFEDEIQNNNYFDFSTKSLTSNNDYNEIISLGINNNFMNKTDGSNNNLFTYTINQDKIQEYITELTKLLDKEEDKLLIIQFIDEFCAHAKTDTKICAFLCCYRKKLTGLSPRKDNNNMYI